MRLHILVEITIREQNIGVTRRKLAGFNAKLDTDIYGGDVLGYNYTIHFNGDHEIGLSVMDIVEQFPHHYLVAYLADSTGITQLLKVE